MNNYQKIGLIITLSLLLLIIGLHNPFGGYTRIGIIINKRLASPSQANLVSLVREAYPEYMGVNDTLFYNNFKEKYPDFIEQYYQLIPNKINRFIDRFGDLLPNMEKRKTTSNNARLEGVDEIQELVGFISLIFLFGLGWFIIFKD